MDQPAPIPMNAADLADLLHEIANRVEEHDSFDGSLTYNITEREKDEYDVQGLYRHGNARGQGFTRVLQAHPQKQHPAP